MVGAVKLTAPLWYIAMKKTDKILITVILLVFAVIGIDCIIGFTIGGEIRLIHIVILVAIHLVLTYLSILFINGKEYEKSDGYKEALILITIGLVAISYVMYGGLNRLSASNDSVVYDTYIEETNTYEKTIFTEVGFRDRNNNLGHAWDKTIMWYDDDSFPEEGAPITIREKQGGFGYPVYELVAINGNTGR